MLREPAATTNSELGAVGEEGLSLLRGLVVELFESNESQTRPTVESEGAWLPVGRPIVSQIGRVHRGALRAHLQLVVRYARQVVGLG